MALPFQVGELVQRIRRALVIVGPAPLDLDERVELSATAINLDAAPWRGDGARFYGSTSNPGTAAQLTQLAVGTPAIGGGATHVIDGIWLTLPGAVSLLNLGFFGVNPSPFVALARYPERGDPLTTQILAASSSAGPIGHFSGTAAASGLLSPGYVSVRIPTLQTYYIPLEVTIQNNSNITAPLLFGVETAVANIPLEMSYTGRSFNVNPAAR